MDEKGLTPHYEPPKTVSAKGKKLLTVTPPRGATTTLLGAGNAMGYQIPPYFIFKGERFQHKYLEKATPGAAGTVSPTGWSNGSIFTKYLQDHFLKYVQRPHPTDPVLLMYDGHKTHITVEVLDWAKRNNIVLFVLLAHLSHILQPLDVSCFGALEKSFTKAKHAAVRYHASGNLSASKVCELACKAYQDAMKPQNLASGFRKTGIYPFTGMEAIDPANLTPATAFQERDDHAEEARDFFEQREVQLDVKRGETRKRKVIGAIAGGKEITHGPVEQDLRDHISKYSKKPRLDAPSTSRFDPLTCCCVCQSEVPPLEDSEDISWVACDRCDHWVHQQICIPELGFGRENNFLCPCCIPEE